MATNLHAMIRYNVIDRCLRDQDRNYHAKDLIRECSEAISEKIGEERVISRRTFFNDLEAMRHGVLGYNAPIEYDRTEGYYYSNSSFSIKNVPLKDHDLKELDRALLLLKQFSGKENLIEIESVISRLEHTLNIKRTRNQDTHIAFDHSLNEKGQKWISIIHDAIKAKKCIHIKYEPFLRDEYSIIVSPLLLKEYNNRWFLFAKNKDYETVTNLSLDRITNVSPSIQAFDAQFTFDASSYLKNIIGVTLPEGKAVQKIKIVAYGMQSNYLRTKPLHHSQKEITSNDRETTFSYQLIPNYELESHLLSFGDKIKVIAPVSLKKKMKERLLASLEHYV